MDAFRLQHLRIIIQLSNVPLKFIVKGLKAVLILIIFSAAFNLFPIRWRSGLKKVGN